MDSFTVGLLIGCALAWIVVLLLAWALCLIGSSAEELQMDAIAEMLKEKECNTSNPVSPSR